MAVILNSENTAAEMGAWLVFRRRCNWTLKQIPWFEPQRWIELDLLAHRWNAPLYATRGANSKEVDLVRLSNPTNKDKEQALSPTASFWKIKTFWMSSQDLQVNFKKQYSTKNK